MSSPRAALRSPSLEDDDPTEEARVGAAGERMPIDLGWLLVGHLDEVDRHAITEAHQRVSELLREHFPQFRWRLPLVHQADYPPSLRAEPARLLEHGADERDSRRWDFVLVVTSSELVSHYQSPAWATPSRSLGVGVISTARIDPHARQGAVSHDDRRRALVQRIFALALHTLGHLGGAKHVRDPRCAMHEASEVEELDAVEGFDAATIRMMADDLQRVADLRLEEEPLQRAAIPFYLRASALNWRTIFQAILRAEPWLLPLRLSRLTAAALTTVFVLATTAESWDVAASNRVSTLAGLALAALLATAAYVIKRQHLFLGRPARLAEQAVVTRVSITGIVLIGLLSTFALLMVVSLALGTLLYPESLVQAWIANPDATSGLTYTRVAIFLAAVGLVVGALGASFEDQQYFRHVAYVDEET